MSVSGASSSAEAEDALDWTSHLDWTGKQGRILTDEGRAIRHYSEENGFPFLTEELPHHYLEKGTTHATFSEWAREARAASSMKASPSVFTLPHGTEATVVQSSPIIGVWDRPIFAGKWEHSTNDEEVVYNVQTGTLFVDLRIPQSKPVARWEKLEGLDQLSDQDLRLYARQHVFGGYSMLTMEKARTGDRPMCTRHHCVDWNYITGKPRPRPNKWYIESKNDADPTTWLEWSYSKDENGQSYYYERWERIKGDDNGEGLCLAMRKKISKDDDVDGILVVVGDHFNYILGRQMTGREKLYPDAFNLVELVDTAIDKGDRGTAISYLTLDGGHGTISSGWKIDCSIQSWNHGMRVFDRIGAGKVQVSGDGCDFFSWNVIIGKTAWDVYECSLGSPTLLEELLQKDCKSQSRL